MEKAFAADMARFDVAFRKADALVTWNDGFVSIDETKIPAAMLSAYQRLVQFGAANGMI